MRHPTVKLPLCFLFFFFPKTIASSPVPLAAPITGLRRAEVATRVLTHALYSVSTLLMLPGARSVRYIYVGCSNRSSRHQHFNTLHFSLFPKLSKNTFKLLLSLWLILVLQLAVSSTPSLLALLAPPPPSPATPSLLVNKLPPEVASLPRT